jgi:hypothetical protein
MPIAEALLPRAEALLPIAEALLPIAEAAALEDFLDGLAEGHFLKIFIETMPPVSNCRALSRLTVFSD